MADILSFDTVAAFCREFGLEAIAVLAPVPETLDPTGLDRCLSAGVGDMTWLAAHRDLRLRPRQLLPAAAAVILVLLPYRPDADDGGVLRRARYADGVDYHKLLRKRLSRLGRRLSAGSGHHYRATVDSAPVNERSLAQLAGLGWIGRNALLLHPRRGSYHFIGALFTTRPLQAQHGTSDADRCGTCTACEVACPTAALRDRQVDNTRCISYWTIEHQGVIPRRLAARFAGWWFGCDICQEVCPWNRFALPAGDARLVGSGQEAPDELLSITAADFDHVFAGRAIRRLGWSRFRRNLLVALFSLDRRADATQLLTDPDVLVQEQRIELGW